MAPAPTATGRAGRAGPPMPAPANLAPANLALTILALAAAAVATVWAVQAAGYPPCELCLKERWPYYAGIALAAAAYLLARRGGRRRTLAALFALLALVFLAGAALGTYHAGVEWGWWAGPTDCTGAPPPRAGSMGDFLQQLHDTRVVRCDAAALRVLGLSLAGWNGVAALVLAGIAALGARRARA